MILTLLRALFVLLLGAAGWFVLKQDPEHMPETVARHAWLSMAISLTIGVFVICVDILAPRKKISIFSGAFFGMVVGLLVAWALSFVVSLLVDQYASMVGITESVSIRPLAQYANVIVGIVCCYLAISFIMQTKDDFRFVIPYVEFAKQTKGTRPVLLDSSVLIDGRIVDVAATGIIDSRLIVPQFVIDELQKIADSADRLKRNRGRRGLDVVQKLRSTPKVDVVLYDSSGRDIGDKDAGVDQLLMYLALDLNARVLTNDFNLNKVAELRGVSVINVNDLATALKPVVLPGERMFVRIVKAGDSAGQGVGFLDDGTMVVVENARELVDQEVDVAVTNAVQTKAGRMIFARIDLPGEPANLAGNKPAGPRSRGTPAPRAG